MARGYWALIHPSTGEAWPATQDSARAMYRELRYQDGYSHEEAFMAVGNSREFVEYAPSFDDQMKELEHWREI